MELIVRENNVLASSRGTSHTLLPKLSNISQSFPLGIKFPLINHHSKRDTTQLTLMKADDKRVCVSVLPRDWIWIFIYWTEGVLVIASCNYTREKPKNWLTDWFSSTK